MRDFQQYPSGERVPAFLVRRPRDICDSSMKAEVSIATASALREKALLDYREARCRGAVWLWTRAMNRAGGARTILVFVLHLWSNYSRRVKARRACVDAGIHNRDRRRWRIVLRCWSVAAHAQSLERKLVAQQEAGERSSAALEARLGAAEMRADRLATRVRDLERMLELSQQNAVLEEEQEDAVHESNVFPGVGAPSPAPGASIGILWASDEAMLAKS